jgi:hypothetical protein
VIQPESHNSAGPAPTLEYATRPAGVLVYLILGLTGPGWHPQPGAVKHRHAAWAAHLPRISR